MNRSQLAESPSSFSLSLSPSFLFTFSSSLMNYARLNNTQWCCFDKNRNVRITLTMLGDCLLLLLLSPCLPMWKTCITNTIYKQNENRTRHHITVCYCYYTLCMLKWMCMHWNHMSLILFYFSAFIRFVSRLGFLALPHQWNDYAQLHIPSYDTTHVCLKC